MKKHNFVSLMLLASIVLWAQVGLEDDPALSDIDLSDVVIIEDVAEASDSVDTGRAERPRRYCSSQGLAK